MLKDYLVLDTINQEHKIYLVKNIYDNCLYVKKELVVFDSEIYRYLCNHPIEGIPRIKEALIINDKLHIIEEYLNGRTLEELLENNYVFTENEIVNILACITKTLIELNKNTKGIVHRDIKPSNIMISNNEVYLIDFNAAKFVDNSKSRDTVLIGTEGYAAPEQYGFGVSTTKTDIFALGMLGKTLSNNTKISTHLSNIIEKSSKLDPNDRYESLDLLLKDLSVKHTKRDYLPIGFRSNKISHKIIAVIAWLFLVSIAFSATTESGSELDLWAFRIAFLLSFIFMVFFSFNYLGILDKLKINSIKKPLLRIILILAIDYLIMMAVFILVLFTISLFS